MSLSTKDVSSHLKAIFICAIIIAAFFSIELGNRRLATPDEGRYVEISREMAESGDFVTPRLNGVKYFEKPPLFYWMEAISLKVAGKNPSFAQIRAVEVGLAVLGCIFVMLANDICNGIDQMGLTQTGIAVDKQRIVVFSRILCYGNGRGIGQFVFRAYHKGFKG